MTKDTIEAAERIVKRQESKRARMQELWPNAKPSSMGDAEAVARAYLSAQGEDGSAARNAVIEECAKVADEGVLIFDGGEIKTPTDMKVIASMTAKVIASGIRNLATPPTEEGKERAT